MSDPAQFGWIVAFQRRQFLARLPDIQAKHFAEFLGPLIDANFRQTPSAAPAFANMTAQLFEEVERNDQRLPGLKQLDIPFQLIWGERDHYLNVGVAQDLLAKLPKATLVTLQAGHWPQIDEPRKVAQAMLQADEKRISAHAV